LLTHWSKFITISWDFRIHESPLPGTIKITLIAVLDKPVTPIYASCCHWRCNQQERTEFWGQKNTLLNRATPIANPRKFYTIQACARDLLTLLAMPPELSSDIWLTIFQFCDRSAWLQLNLVSKGFYVLCLPLIYRDVDLSTHNSGIPHPYHLLARGPNSTPLYIAEYKIKQVQKAQESFLDTLLQHPEYAPFIRTLTWTLMFGPELDDLNWPVEYIGHPHNQTWRVLLTLEKVRRLDLASEHHLMRHAYVQDCPGPLFPAAKSVRLSGIMNEKLIGSIISHHPDRLEELSIDNVQHWGLHADGRPLTDTAHESFTRRWIEEPGIYPPGPIRGIFDSSRRYSNLKDLFLRKAATQYVTDIWWVPEADIAVYKEWASLITSVKGHLRRLTFEQAAPPKGSYIRFRSGNQARRPMDQRFHDYLLPVFLEGGWNNLERLEIRGVGRWNQEDPIVMNDSTKDAIADAVGLNVKLIIVEETCRPAWIWHPLSF
jgi:hypothetical protein